MLGLCVGMFIELRGGGILFDGAGREGLSCLLGSATEMEFGNVDWIRATGDVVVDGRERCVIP